MLKDGSKITAHFINHWNYKKPTEVKTDFTGKIFEVKTENGKQGFDGNISRSPYTSKGELFTPFAAYAWSVIFRDEDTGKLYRHSEIKKGLEEVTGLNDGYINQINWIA
jgi:hypothetical protein